MLKSSVDFNRIAPVLLGQDGISGHYLLISRPEIGIQIVCTFITRKPSGTQSDVTYRLAFVSQLFHTGLSGNLQ